MSNPNPPTLRITNYESSIQYPESSILNFAISILHFSRILTVVIPVSLLGQVSFSGDLNPYNLYRISDGTEISLPFRLGEADIVYAHGSLEGRISLAWETRWSSSLRTGWLDVREAYLSLFLRFGEIKLGQQIHAWGTVDGNNPTDNLSAYDYYYLFLPGTARKIGSLSLSVTAYVQDWKLQGVLIPGHQPNRLPFNEPDFPISLPPEPAEDLWGEMRDPAEYGIRVSRSFRVGDISLSYFKGHDRVFSPVGGEEMNSFTPAVIPQFGYRSTRLVGADWVTFMGSLTVRGEAGYFRTVNDYDDKQFSLKLDADATYSQYVIEVEYPGPWEVNLMGQIIGQTVLKVDGQTLDPVRYQPVRLDKETFHAGLGTPFAMFVDRAFLAAADGLLMDRRLEFSLMALVSLEKTGYMAGLSLDYSPVDNWSLEGGATLFRGDDENIFEDLEDFSHFRVGLKYSF